MAGQAGYMSGVDPTHLLSPPLLQTILHSWTVVLKHVLYTDDNVRLCVFKNFPINLDGIV
jgi:hypothetical protein